MCRGGICNECKMLHNGDDRHSSSENPQRPPRSGICFVTNGVGSAAIHGAAIHCMSILTMERWRICLHNGWQCDFVTLRLPSSTSTSTSPPGGSCIVSSCLWRLLIYLLWELLSRAHCGACHQSLLRDSIQGRGDSTGKPWMSEALFNTKPFRRRHSQQASDQVLGTWRHTAPAGSGGVEGRCRNLLLKRHFLLVEGVSSAEHDKEDSPEAPEVHRLVIGPSPSSDVKHFRSPVLRGTNEGFRHRHAFRNGLRQAEVGNLHIT
mmetsp:Transcript_26220/g.47908  ORF Transcript_26220/g.47908 Transcript_26220/m.47908 type:complete len:263 (+) Transcript_26220:1670-2458(+)